MTLITLLIVLTLERIAATDQLWQFEFYYQKMKSLMFKHLSAEQWLRSAIGRWLWLLIPALVVFGISSMLDWLLLEFIFDVLVLLICIGCVKQRKLYKSFLNAANRGDDEACQLYSDQLTGKIEANDTESATDNNEAAQQSDELEANNSPEPDADFESAQNAQSEQSPQQPPCDCISLGQTLVWFNFRFYCAVLFWFVCLGPAGAVLYCMVRQSVDDKDPQVTTLFASKQQQLQTVLHILDWLPARVCSAGYLLIGNFSRSAGVWISYLLDFTSPAKDLISEISNAAEAVDNQDCSHTSEAACMLKLAKRNILFFLALVALLTLYGGIK